MPRRSLRKAGRNRVPGQNFVFALVSNTEMAGDLIFKGSVLED